MADEITTVIVVIVVSLGYQYFQSYYRASAREVKRLGTPLITSPVIFPECT